MPPCVRHALAPIWGWRVCFCVCSLTWTPTALCKLCLVSEPHGFRRGSADVSSCRKMETQSGGRAAGVRRDLPHARNDEPAAGSRVDGRAVRPGRACGQGQAPPPRSLCLQTAATLRWAGAAAGARSADAGEGCGREPVTAVHALCSSQPPCGDPADNARSGADGHPGAGCCAAGGHGSHVSVTADVHGPPCRSPSTSSHARVWS